MKARIGDQVFDLEGSILGECIEGLDADTEIWVAMCLGDTPERIELIP